MCSYESELGVRKNRWRAFTCGQTDYRYLYMIRYEPDGWTRPFPLADNVKRRIEWAWARYCREVEKLTWLDDDSLPYLDALTGTEMFAEAFGCSVYQPKDDMPAARPLIFSAAEVGKLKVPTLDAPPIRRIFDIADELKKRGGKHALVRTADIQSPMDIAALIWDKNDLYMALVESPEAVKELAHKVKQLLTAFLDEWFRRYGREHIAHYPDYFMDGGFTLSEDEVGVVNEEMFLEFFLPELNELSDRYGGIGMHCCANSKHQWQNFRKIRNLRVLNFVQPKEMLQKAYPFFGDAVVHWHSWNGDGDPWMWKDQHPGRFIIETWAKDRDHAKELSEKLGARK